VHRCGKERNRTQHYRCLTCARAFNDLTRTAMASTHMPEKWQAFADTMRDGLSTRRTGMLVEVNHKTAWRWRHKVIAFVAPTRPPPLGGLVEADETYFRRNLKGSAPVRRRSRRRGTKNGSRRALSQRRHTHGRATRRVDGRRVDRRVPADPAAGRHALQGWLRGDAARCASARRASRGAGHGPQ